MNYLELDPEVENVVSDCITALFDECVRKKATRLRAEANSASYYASNGDLVDYGDWVLEFKQVRKPAKPLPGHLSLPFDGAKDESAEASSEVHIPA